MAASHSVADAEHHDVSRPSRLPPVATDRPSFDVHIGRTSGGVVVSLDGRCDNRGLGFLEHVLKDLFEGQGNSAVTLDASRLHAADPGVWYALASAEAWAERRGALLRISHWPAD